MIIKSPYNSYDHNGIHQRIIRAKDGRLVRVYFVVSKSEIDGRLKGQIISIESVENVAAGHSATGKILLPSTVIPKESTGSLVRNIPTTAHVSPLSVFDFFMSQPTRAPSLFA